MTAAILRCGWANAALVGAPLPIFGRRHIEAATALGSAYNFRAHALSFGDVRDLDHPFSVWLW